ncbi:MAG: M48 family metalloprotease [Planctomycetes bacterium]|nr:M48 family metalloprotease [Planctomycetota bacterium]
MSKIRKVVFLAMLLSTVACKAIDETSGAMADALARPDPVTGARTLNVETEQAEVAAAAQRVRSMLDDARSKSVPVDQDAALVRKLQEMLTRLAPVSHRPGLPWEIHVIGVQEPNAFTIGGGKMFFFSGVRELAQTDDELAAVLAHEMAHNTCRHITEAQSAGLASSMSRSMRRDASSPFYAAAYSTEHEDEADRVSLLYLALAGYDPGVVPGIWERAHRKWGSNPGNFTYDHSLNADRAGKTAALVPTARTALAGRGIANPDADRLKLESPLIERQATSSGFLALLETVANTMASHAEVSAEAAEREAAARRTGHVAPSKAAAPRSADVPSAERDLTTAIHLHQSGRLADAESAYERVLASRPSSVPALYNLACICAVQGREKRALNLLDRAVDAGFRDAAHMKADSDLASLRGNLRYREIVRRATAR